MSKCDISTPIFQEPRDSDNCPLGQDSFQVPYSLLPQFDGNFSILDSESICDISVDEESNKCNAIPVLVGNRWKTLKSMQRANRANLKTIRRDNRGEVNLYLPNIAVYNHRSLPSLAGLNIRLHW